MSTHSNKPRICQSSATQKCIEVEFKNEPSRDAWAAFVDRSGRRGSIADNTEDVGQSVSSRLDCGTDLLAYAKLYVFADRYLIQSLRELTLDKLHGSLIKYKLEAGSIAHVVDLIGYTCENTVEETIDTVSAFEQKDGMRALVFAWTICKASSLVNFRDFVEMLPNNPPFASAFACGVAKVVGTRSN